MKEKRQENSWENTVAYGEGLNQQRTFIQWTTASVKSDINSEFFKHTNIEQSYT